MSISELLSSASESPLESDFRGQIQSIKQKQTKGGKPYFEWNIADSTGSLTLKIWNNHPQWEKACEIKADLVLRFSGEWIQNQYGLDGRNWNFSRIAEEEIESFFAGDPSLLEKQKSDWEQICNEVSKLRDPRIRELCSLFIEQYGLRFRRSAAARRNHHARRGGLVEHVAQMMRSAVAICSVYPYLNRDLMIAGVLFHDCGKIWENTYPERGFNQLQLAAGEMIGHIPLGLELVNKLWRELPHKSWSELEPPNEEIRLHLLHLIASHHGQYEFGSPTLPKTPEAYALHYIDNLDAKLEMVKDAYASAQETAPGIYERQFPLQAPLIKPLTPFENQIPSQAKEVSNPPPGHLF
jgi:3'-5' exoribonuclease